MSFFVARAGGPTSKQQQRFFIYHVGIYCRIALSKGTDDREV